MTALAEAVPVQLDWPKEVARRSLDRQRSVFGSSRPDTRVILAPRVNPDVQWFGDASLLHDLGWWWLFTLRISRTLLSMGYKTLGEAFGDKEVLKEISEEGFQDSESILLNPHLLRMFLESRVQGLTPADKAFLDDRPLVEVVKRLQATLTEDVLTDLRQIRQEAERRLVASPALAPTITKLVSGCDALLVKLEQDRKRSLAWKTHAQTATSPNNPSA